MTTTVVGIGNVLLGDDGAGVWLARALHDDYAFEPDIEVLDGGTLGLGLATYLSETDRLLVIDAVAAGGPPGTIVTLREADVPATLRAAFSAHEASLCDLLATLTLLGKMPSSFVAIGIVPERIEPTVTLSEPVRAALPAAERAVIAQLAAWDVRATRTIARATELRL